MTYNVFGGTLNLAQLNVSINGKIHFVIIMRTACMQPRAMKALMII